MLDQLKEYESRQLTVLRLLDEVYPMKRELTVLDVTQKDVDVGSLDRQELRIIRELLDNLESENYIEKEKAAGLGDRKFFTLARLTRAGKEYLARVC